MIRLLPALLLICACAPAPTPGVGLPWTLINEDRGDVSGVWREIERDGQHVRTGYFLTIDLGIGTFAVQKGCAATGGVLAPLGGDLYRIDRYTRGFAAAGCRPWRSSPELTPFDADQVRLVRDGRRLTATGAGSAVQLVRVTRG